MLKMYMGFDSEDGSEGGAVLIFAHNAKEARDIGHPYVADFFSTDWIHMRVRWLKHAEHLRAEGVKEKLDNDIPHVIDSPRICPNCELWGNTPIKLKDGREVCEGCRDEYEDMTGETIEGATP